MSAVAPLLHYGRQTIEDDDIEAVAAVLRSPWLTCGPTVERLESAFAKAVGASHAVVCASGTAALHLANVASHLGPRDAVIVPALTFVATANAARFCGAEVVFADVDGETGLLTERDLEVAVVRARAAGLSPKTVVPVHLNGQVCAMPELARAAERSGLTVIEDACHAVGSEYTLAEGAIIRVGACRHSAMTVFSLHPVKTLTMGEGGIVTTNDAELARRLRQLRNHGVVREAGAFTNASLAHDVDGSANPWYMEFHELGFNYRANEMQCALGLSQLAKLDRFVAARRGLVGCYRERLSSIAPLVRPIQRAPGCCPAWHLAVAMIDFAAASVSRGRLVRRLAACGIGTQVHYVPLHLQPYYRNRYGTRRLAGAERYYERCLSLPLFPTMSAGDVDRVVDALRGCLRGDPTP